MYSMIKLLATTDPYLYNDMILSLNPHDLSFPYKNAIDPREYCEGNLKIYERNCCCFSLFSFCFNNYAAKKRVL